MTTNRTDDRHPSAAHGISVEVEALGIKPDGGGPEILKEISFSLKPGEFVCLLGPSGAGKTTLVRALLGQLTPSRGEIRFGSLRISGDDEALAGLVGYVPQKEIVHEVLPVGRALHYAAKLRLPPALGARGITERIRAVETDVGIAHCHEMSIRNLSGGESKRVSLAAELLSLPRILIVDEATSSLDPACDARIMHLLAEYAKKYSITLLCITHHLENAKLADRLLILGSGHLVWSGGVKEALDHFRVHRLSQIYMHLEDLPEDEWLRYRKDGQIANDRGADEKGIIRGEELPPPVDRPGWVRQFCALLSRGVEVLVRDQRSLALLIGGPLVMALLVYMGFAGENFTQKALISRPMEPREIQLAGQLWGYTQQALAMQEDMINGDASVSAQIRVFLDKETKLRDRLRSPESETLIRRVLAGEIPIVPDREISNPWPTWKFRFAVLFGILIIGFLAGLTEIVKERPIIERELAGGVRASAYVATKFVLIGAVLAVQIVPGVLLLQEAFRLEGSVSPLGDIRPFIALAWLAGMVCAGTGLVISSIVKTREQALLAFPILILPQLILCGMLIRLTGGALTTLAKLFIPAFWAFRGSIDYIQLKTPFPLYDLGKHYTFNQAACALVMQLAGTMILVWLAFSWSTHRHSSAKRR